MGLNVRKSIKAGPARVNVSKSGVGYSVGAGGVRYTKSARGKKNSDSGGCIGTIVKWSIYLGLALLALYVLGNYWPWVLGGLAVIAAIYFGIRIYKAKNQQNEE